MQTDYDNDLQSYFTDMEHLRDMFKDFVSAEKLPKRLIVFHGVGGVGKSSLLRMFRLHCKSEKIPVALASGDDAKSTLDVITRWMEDLKEDKVKFSALHKTLESYRVVQAKVEDQAKKSQNKVADIAGKAASKTAEAAGGALLGAAIGSVIPGVGTAIGGMLGSAVGGMGAEALTDWLRGFLDKSSIDLLLDPAKKLTSDFLEDIAKAAEKKRMVLLLDTYEQMSALEDWVGETAQKIHPNVLMVIAGRKLPNWNRVWSGWMMNAQVEELKPMTEDIMRELIHRYYATMRGGEPDPAQVDAVVEFARGLPIAVTSVIQLWIKYPDRFGDLKAVSPEVIPDLVDRLMEGVPSLLIPALEAAAIVRWFDQPILRAVLNKEDVRDVYNELRRFPFVRARVEGLALHDSVREMMDKNLRVQDSERHSELHECAAVYFEKRLGKVTGEETERLELERLYHRVRADEETGIKLFQEMAEELTRYRLINRLRALLNDANTYPLERENSKMWREYYAARVMYLEAYFIEGIQIYESIEQSNHSEPKLRAYALSDLGQILEIMGAHDRSIPILKTSLSIVPTDSHLAIGLLELCHAYRRTGNLAESEIHLLKARDFYAESGDKYGQIYTLNAMKYHYLNQGNTQKAKLFLEQSKQMLSTITPTPKYLRLDIIGGLAIYWAWLLGTLHESELNIRQTQSLADELGLVEPGRPRDLGYILGIQEKYDEAEMNFTKSNMISNQLGRFIQAVDRGITSGFRGAVLKRQGSFDEAEVELRQSLDYKQRTNDSNGMPELRVWLGELLEVKAMEKSSHVRTTFLETALTYFHQALGLRWTGRCYFECAALTGLVRVKHAQGDIAAIPSLLAEAEQLAQQYEYNDDLASLRLTQGHLAFEGWGDVASPAQQNKTISPLQQYQHAMIYALRYNRFLLDELLSGRPQGTPLHPIIPYCLERGEEGKKILLALRDWWKTGVNDVGAPRPDTISPIPEGIPLLDAEKIAREREPGDGSMQRSVIEQIDAMLAAVYK